jgi:hypothetical protein
LNTIFNISSEADDTSNLLLCEWGEDHFCLAGYDSENKKLINLEYFSFEKNDADALFQVIELVEKRKKDDLKIVFCSAFPQAVLTPSKLYDSKNNILKDLYGQRFSFQLNDVINEWQVVNVYAFPATIYKSIVKAFPSANFFHVYTTELKIYNGFVAENQVAVHFTPKYFRVVVKQNGQLQLAQMYFYNAPLDVVYYLLKIFQELNLEKEDTYVLLSGLIEENSALYKEIESYFFNVHFALPSIIHFEHSEHPTHFFNSMFNLALCVS